MDPGLFALLAQELSAVRRKLIRSLQHSLTGPFGVAIHSENEGCSSSGTIATLYRLLYCCAILVATLFDINEMPNWRDTSCCKATDVVTVAETFSVKRLSWLKGASAF